MEEHEVFPDSRFVAEVQHAAGCEHHQVSGTNARSKIPVGIWR